MGTSASSDGQFFPTARHGEAMNMVNAKYGSVPGLKAFTHVGDQFAPFACQSIPASTVYSRSPPLACLWVFWGGQVSPQLVKVNQIIRPERFDKPRSLHFYCEYENFQFETESTMKWYSRFDEANALLDEY